MTLTRYSVSLLLVAALFGGCLPASRTAHNGEQSRRDAETLRTAAATGSGLSAERRQVLMAAEKWLGSPYVYGGSSPNGTDCSGFVRSVFRDVRVPLPRTSGEQAGVGTSVARSRLLAGDLLFFNTTGSGVSHVGISIGSDRFIHASTSRGVIVSSLDEEYYNQRFLFARRIL